MLAEATDEFVRVGDEWWQALALFVEMELHCAAEAMDPATETAHRALAIFRRLGDHWGTSAVRYHLGLALHRAGHLHAALRTYEAALAEGRLAGAANTIPHRGQHGGSRPRRRGQPAGVVG